MQETPGTDVYDTGPGMSAGIGEQGTGRTAMKARASEVSPEHTPITKCGKGNVDSKKPRSILIIRLSAMGDVAMTVPVVAALRRAYPGLRITVLTRGFFRPFFRDIDGIDFIVPDFGERHKGFPGLLRLWREAGRFDMVADLHDVIRSKLLRKLFALSGSRVKHIDKGSEEKKQLTRPEHKILKRLKPTVERYRDVFTSLGLEIPPVEAPARRVIPLKPMLAAMIGERRPQEKWIGIAPFAQHLGKIYPPEKMTEVVRLLNGTPGNRIFIFGGGASEREYAENVEREVPGTMSVIGKLSLDSELDLISNLDVMVSMDSSSMHMASLYGVPVVSVWGATHPFSGFYGLGQDPSLAIGMEMDCRPCSIYGNKPCFKGGYPCMHGIAPQTIADKVNAVIRAQ